MTEKQEKEQATQNRKNEREKENEESFLGSLILITTFNEEMPLLKIQAKNFSHKSNGLIFQTIFKQIKKGIKPDIKSLTNDPDLADVEPWYISGLNNKVPSSANIMHYESEIIKAWQTQIAKHATQNFKTKIESAEYKGEIDPLIREFMEVMAGAVCDTQYSRFSTWKEYFNNCVSYDPSKDFKPSMLAGLRFPNGTLSYIGARPGGGKSTMLVNIAREALDAGRKVFLVNMEMINKTIITNFALSTMYASATEEQRKELKGIENPQSLYYCLFKREYDSRETFDSLRHNAIKKTESLLDTSLYIFNGAGGKLDAILMAIESKLNEGDIVLIDYIQRMPPALQGSSDQRYIQIKQTSEKLLNAAMKKNVVIISGAQFKRPDNERSKEAGLEDFRESGDIEQDAHNALGIEYINEKSRYIHVLKQREGGAKFTREDLDCNFNYLYIAGTGREHDTGNKKVKSTKQNGTASGASGSEKTLWKLGSNKQ